MKQIRSLVGFVTACGIALAMVTSVYAQNAQQGIAKVVNIKGSARYMTAPGEAWQPLKSGTILKPGAIIQTASDSHVDLVFNSTKAGSSMSMTGGASGGAGGAGDPGPSSASYQPKAEQDAMRIFENSVLSLDKLTIDQTGVDTVTETMLDLKAGSIFASVKKLSASSKYEVKIPNGVAGIRGTTYYLSAAGILRVTSGLVHAAWVGNDGAVATKGVNAGEQLDMRSGQVTPILSTDASQMNAVAEYFRFESGRNPAGSMSYPGDRTLYYVSPVRGQNSQGNQNQNGQG